LKTIGIDENELQNLYAILDKRNKLPEDAFAEMLVERIPSEDTRRKVLELMSIKSIDEIGRVVELQAAAQESVGKLRRLFELLAVMGVGDYCVFDIGIVRGLAYYTGIVYEIYDRGSQLRAIGGGGRYDDLLKQFGGPAITATGFGMGDCVLGILLEEKGLLQKQLPLVQPDFFVAAVDERYYEKTIEIVAKIRRAGFAANFSYKPSKLTKQLKQASDQHTKKCIIVGDEFMENKLAIKDMATGRQELVEVDRFFESLRTESE
jgi:histidyl-tRNA synthetase